MNIVDAACSHCGRFFRWLPGTPLRCPDCQRSPIQSHPSPTPDVSPTSTKETSMRKPIRTATFAALLFLIAGCSNGQPHPLTVPPLPTPSAMERACPTARRVVVLLDRTGSYSLAQTGIDQAAALIERTACPGDSWLVRWIDDASYAPSAEAMTISFGALPAAPAPPANPLERRRFAATQKRFQGMATAFHQQRQAAANSLRQTSFALAPASDIVGALAKADDLLATTPAGQKPVLLIATDFEDNVGFTTPFALHGAAVIVLAFEGDDPDRAHAIRQEWQARFEAAGARAVTFHDPSEPPSVVLTSFQSAGR